MAGDYAPSFYVASFEQQVPSARPSASAPLLTAVPHSAYGGQVYYSDGNAPPSAGYAPPSAGYAPPSAGYAPPSAGYAPPSAGYAPPSAGYAPPSAGYAPPSAGYAPPSAGYAPPSAGYAPPSAGYAPPSAGYALAQAGYAPPPQHLSTNQYPAPVPPGKYAVPIRQAQPQQIFSEYIPAGGLLVYHQQQPRLYAPPAGANIYQQGAIYNVPQQQQGQGLYYPAQASNPSVHPPLQQHQQPPAQIHSAVQQQPLQQPGYHQQPPQQYYSAPHNQAPPSAMDSQQQLPLPAYQNQAERSASVRRSRSGDRIAAARAGRDNSNNVWAGARAQQTPPVVYPVPPQNQASPASGPGHRQLQQPAHKSPRPGVEASRSGRAISQQPRAPSQGSISGLKAAPAISAYCDMQTNETYAFDAPPLAYRNQRANAPPTAYGSESKESNKSYRSAKSNKSLKSKKSKKGPSHGNANLALSPSVSKDSLNRVSASLKRGCQ